MLGRRCCQRSSLKELDAGEAEALVQGSENGVEVFIGDEKLARKMSLLRGIRPVGTARLLARMNIEGYAGDVHTLIRRLRKECAYRVKDEIVNDAIKAAHDPI